MADWDARFLEVAVLVSKWSKDPSTKVGAVIAKGKFVVSLGFNGHPARVADSAERLEIREIKYRTIIHAEINAILSAGKPLEGVHTLRLALHALFAVRLDHHPVRHPARGNSAKQQRTLGGKLPLHGGAFPRSRRGTRSTFRCSAILICRLPASASPCSIAPE